MPDLVLSPLQTTEAEAYWRVFIAGRTDLPSRSVSVHMDRYLRLSPEEQRTYYAFRQGPAIVGTIRILPGTAESPGANLTGFSMDSAHSDLASAAIIKAVDRLRAQGQVAITAGFEEQYEPAFVALGFRPWFARIRMEAPVSKGPVDPAFRLRPPEEPEVPGLTRFFMDVYEGHIEQTFGMHVGSEADWRGYIAGIFKGDEGRYMPDASFVSLEGDRIVGAILTTDWMEGPLVAELGVAHDRRGRGLGRALLQATLNRLAELEMPRLALFTTVGNDSAIHLYKGMDFAQVGGRSVSGRLE